MAQLSHINNAEALTLLVQTAKIKDVKRASERHAYKLFFIKNMTELTTGVVFLMASLYGSAQSANHMQNIAFNQAPEKGTVVEETDSIENISDRKEMEAFLRKEFADTPLLVEIARCESSFRQYDDNGFLIRGRVNRNDVGVMQINEKYHIETAKKLGINIYTLKGNIEYAKHLYDEQGSKPWSSSKPCWSKGSAIAQK